MSFRTRLQQIWRQPLHPAWIILAMVEIGVLVVFVERFVLHRVFSLWGFSLWSQQNFWMQDIHRMLWGSYIDAGGVRVGEGILAFSGKLVRGIWRSEHVLIIVSMVLSYLVGPSLFIWGMKARKLWLTEDPARRSAFPILAATALGGYIVFFALLIPVEASFGSWSIWQTMKSDMYVNAARDGAVSSVSVLGFQAQQLRLLPQAKGGGPWMKGPGGITIAEIDTVLPRLERGLWETGVRPTMKYVLEVESPDSLTIWGMANIRGGLHGSTFINKDSTTGNVQVRVGVTAERVTAMVEN
jgi:hypothetical protein